MPRRLLPRGRRHEVPLWLPERLHLMTCAFCRGIVRYRREQRQQVRRG